MPEEITTTTTTYTLAEMDKLEEISAEAYQRAYQWVAEANTDDSFWHEHMTDDKDGTFKVTAASRGFDMRAFYFSGFYSQGNGANFSASVEYETFIRANKLGNRYRRVLNHVRGTGMGCAISAVGHYSHSGTMRVTDADHYTEPLNDTGRAYESSELADIQLADLQEDIIDAARELADDFYAALREEYEYLTGEQAVKESADANGYRFTADGEVF